MSSHTTAHHKLPSLETRQKLLTLLELEGQVTRTRMAESLGVSRMTADRLVDQLLSLGLVSELCGEDPRTGRKSRLVTLSSLPPCLLLEADENNPYMAAYHLENGQVRGFHAEYHLIYSRAGNVCHLRDMARTLWRLSDHVPCLLLQPANTDDPQWLSENGIVPIDEADAIAAYLSGQPALTSCRSLLHLRADACLFTNLYVRHPQDDFWFSLMEPQIFNLPDTEKRSDGQQDISAILPFLSAYQSCFSADALLVEKSAAELSSLSPFEVSVPCPDLLRHKELTPHWMMTPQTGSDGSVLLPIHLFCPVKIPYPCGSRVR